MTDTKNTRPFAAALSGGAALARQLLDGLRRRVAAELGHDANTEEDAAAIAEKVQAKMRLRTDKAAYAIALGYCLAPHFPNMKALVATKAFVIIRGRDGHDADAVGGVLADALVMDAGRVARNPHYGLESKDRFVIITDASVRHSSRLASTIAQAAERCLPIFCTLLADEPNPDALAGADLELHLPPMTPEMLALLFEASHDEVPADVLGFVSAEKLRTDSLVTHVRRGRPAAECLTGLQQVVNPPSSPSPKTKSILLGDLAGYGQAKAWGLELAQDLKLWREGKLNWDEVDHRAVILAGPPGTGKTSFATVLASTLEVPLIASNVAEWSGHKHLSGTLNRMKEVFNEAMSKTPAVLLVDELDGISSRSRIGGEHVEYWTQIVNQMLVLVTEAMNTPGLVIVGATNHVDRIDPALVRSGRLDRIIHIEPPNADGLAAILAHYAGVNIAGRELTILANRLVGQTGADIERLVRAAKASARRAGRVFSLADIEAQIPDPYNNLPARVRRRIAIYRNAQRIVAQVLDLAEMVSNAQDLGRVLAKSLSQERFHTEQTCNDILAVIMAGRAGEEIVFGDVSTFGSSIPGSDLATATAIANDIERKTGFGECGLVYLDAVGREWESPTHMAASVRRRLDAALARASAILLDNSGELERFDSEAFKAVPNLRALN